MNHVLFLGAIFRFRRYCLTELSYVLGLFRIVYCVSKAARLVFAFGGNASVKSSSPLDPASHFRTMVKATAPATTVSSSHVEKHERPDKAGCSNPTNGESQYIV